MFSSPDKNCDTNCETVINVEKHEYCNSSGGLLQLIAPEEMLAYKIPNQKPRNNKQLTIATWNVRSLSQPGKLENVLSEMNRLYIDILGVSETFWDGEGEFETELPTSAEKFRVIYSGGNKKRKGVAFILRSNITVQSYEMITERIICIKITAKPVDLILIQCYAPTNDAVASEVENFYQQIDEVIKKTKQYCDCLIVMGDLNGKVGEAKEEDIVGPFGLGQRNENGQSIVECCRRHNLMVANTWFETKKSTRHTWTSPDGATKNQIDFILVDKRFRNGVKNSKVRTSADCGSDHNIVIAQLYVRLQKVICNKKVKNNCWNTEILKSEDSQMQFKEISEESMKQITVTDDVNTLWTDIKASIVTAAEEVCGKRKLEARQKWMTTEILEKMEERRLYKNDVTQEGQKRYKELKHEVQKLCRQAYSNYCEDKCYEIEHLEATHNPLLYRKIKEMTAKKHVNVQGIKDKDGNLLLEPQKVLERWAQYVEDLYNDQRGNIQRESLLQQTKISENEVISAIDKSKGKATGIDNIPAEFIKTLGETGIQLITRLINLIYNTGIIPEDFLQTIFITLPKTNRAQDCSDFRTISLISHTSKILLHIINSRITPIIEQHLSDNQMGFRKGRGTRDAIFKFRTIAERAIQVDKKTIYVFRGLPESI